MYVHVGPEVGGRVGRVIAGSAGELLVFMHGLNMRFQVMPVDGVVFTMLAMM